MHPASVLLRYILDRNLVCIVKSANQQRIKENIRLVKENQFQLTKEDFELIRKQIPTRFRYYKMNDGINSKEHPFKHWKDFIPLLFNKCAKIEPCNPYFSESILFSNDFNPERLCIRFCCEDTYSYRQ